MSITSLPVHRRATLAAAVALTTLVAGAGASAASAAAPLAALSAEPAPLTFDNVLPGGSATQSFALTNVATTPAVITTVVNEGRDARDFGIAGDACSGATLAPGASCAVAVRFAPTIDGTRISNIKLASTTGCVVYVNIAGGATKATPQVQAGTSRCLVPAGVTASAASTSSAGSATATPGTSTTTTIISATSPRICRSRRTVTVHLRRPAGVVFDRVIFRLRGRVIKTVAARRGKPITADVDLRGLPRGRFDLRIRATTTSGRVVKRTRHFVTCVPKKAPAAG